MQTNTQHENTDNEWVSMADMAQEYLRRQSIPMLDYNADYFTKLRTIRQYYEQTIGKHIEEYNKTGYQYFSPYPYDWAQIFTPIEFSAWCAIRYKGLKLFPQYPVDKYMLDFGNPYLKIGVELDGKNYHEKAKDTARDTQLKTHGWTIIRITGSEMERTNFQDVVSDFDLFHDSENDYYQALRYWFLETGDGVLEAVKIRYFDGVVFAPDDYWEQKIRTLAEETIYKHTLI